MAIYEIVVYSIFIGFLSFMTINSVSTQAKTVQKQNNKIIFAKIQKINTAINNYCEDSAYSGVPTLDDLNSSNYLPNFLNDNGIGGTFNIDFSGYGNKAYELTTKIDLPNALKDFQSNFLFRSFGSVPICDNNESSSNYGNCTLVIALNKECI